MKLKYFLPLLALGMPLLSNAVPAYPGVIGSTNPDGSVVEIRLHGDEYFSYATDAEGVNILERNSEGYWVQAMRNGAPLLNVPADIERLQQESSNLTTREGNRFARVGEDGRSLFPTQGSNRFLIVLMQYRDTKFSMEDPQAFYTRWFNEENFQHDDLNHSARDYYMAASNNIFQPTFDVSPVVTLPKTSKYYVGGNKYSLFSEAIRVSLATLDNNGFDFTPYDADNDGKIDNVYFIYAGYGQADTGDTNCIWPHKSDMSYYGLRYDGLLMTAYACSNELRGSQHYNTKDGALEGIGTFCHEFGHVLLGLGDEYVGGVSYNDMYPADVEPWEENLTTLVDFERKAWHGMIEEGTPIPTPVDENQPRRLGVYEGGGYVDKGVYRPWPNCMMNNLHTIDVFCPVCTAAIQKQIDFLCR